MARNEIVAKAVSQIGYKEGSNNNTKYGAAYGMNNQPWCLMFIWWCAREVGVTESVIPKLASCSAAVNWFKTRGLYKARGEYTPTHGDLAFFDFDGGTADHVGIVEKVSGSTLYTIEGNTGDAVKRKTYALSNSTIAGYAIPAYQNEEASGVGSPSGTAGNTAVVSLQMALNSEFGAGLDVDGIVGSKTRSAMTRCLLKLNSKGKAVRWAQARLIAKGYSCGSYGADGIFGTATRSAVIAFQRANDLAADGVVGINTYTALLAA